MMGGCFRKRMESQLARAFAAVLEESGLKRDDVPGLADIDRSTVYRILIGRPCQHQTLLALGQGLGRVPVVISRNQGRGRVPYTLGGAMLYTGSLPENYPSRVVDARRQELGWSQGTLAEKVGAGQVQTSIFLNGRRPPITSTVESFCRPPELGLVVRYLAPKRAPRRL